MGQAGLHENVGVVYQNTYNEVKQKMYHRFRVEQHFTARKLPVLYDIYTLF